MIQPIPIALVNQARQKPQPYQERFLAALQSGERLETFSERWSRELSKSRTAFIDLACLLAFHIPGQSPTLGRKRRARRARGRQIQMNQRGPNA
jgi:hypothetical protein